MSDNTIGSEGRVHNRLMVLEQREGVLKGASVDLWHRMQMECGGSELRAVLLGRLMERILSGSCWAPE